LDFKSPYQLLAATILSAQCTDVRVNKVSPELFQKYPRVQDLAEAPLPEVEALIRSTGFFHSKAKALISMAQAIVKSHGGRVPRTLEELVQLRGVGRKTANVVLGNAFGVPGIVVDTHVGRLARRLGLSVAKDPEKVEQDLGKIIPQPKWTLFSHWLVFHGRAVCLARKPKCGTCTLAKACPKRGVKKELR